MNAFCAIKCGRSHKTTKVVTVCVLRARCVPKCVCRRGALLRAPLEKLNLPASCTRQLYYV